MKFKISKLVCLALSIFMLLSVLPTNISYLKSNIHTEQKLTVQKVSVPHYYAFIDVDTVIAGDIDGDGEETNQDLILLFQYLSGWNVDVVELALDVDDDGETTNQDLILLFQHLSGWNVEIYPQCEHTGGTATCCSKAICEKCHKAYGKFDSSNHVGGTEIRNKKTEDCTNNGYSGDVCCKGCGAVFTAGTTIPALNHTGGVATCKDKAICERCGKPYGELDPENHTGNTEIRNQKAASCTEYGYSGDTYCKDCNKLLSSGVNTDPPTGHTEEVRGYIPATCQEPGYTGDIYCSVCNIKLGTGSVTEQIEHAGGTATYYRKAVCEMCHQEYGDYAQMYAYDSLTDNQKRVYNILDENINNLETEFDLSDFLSPDEAVSNLGTNKYKLKSFWETGWEQSQFDVELYCYAYLYETYLAFKALNYDKPEYFWSPSNIRVQCSIMSKGGKLSYKTFALITYPITKSDKEQKLQLLEAKVDEVIALTENFSSNFEKEIAIHDYLCETITYDHDTADLIPVDESEPHKIPVKDKEGNFLYYGYYNLWSFTSYGALVDGCAVCEGYSRAMQLICQRIGIPCGLVTGTAIEEDDEYTYETPHMWNIINPGDGCYYLDVTFDDPTDYDGPGLHTYFNKTGPDMIENHILDDDFSESIFNYATVDFNYFDTYGDNTALEYYTATGAYIGSDGVGSAAEFVLNHSDMVYIDIMFDTALYTSESAVSALRKALGLNKLPYYECTENIIAIVLS